MELLSLRVTKSRNTLAVVVANQESEKTASIKANNKSS